MYDTTSRLMKPTDESLIYATWLKSARKLNDHKFMTNTVYYDNEKKQVEKVLRIATTFCIVNKDDNDQIFSWISFSFLPSHIVAVHYMFTKLPYRNFGFLKDFFKKEFTGKTVILTEISPQLLDWKDNHDYSYNPYVLEQLLEAKT